MAVLVPKRKTRRSKKSEIEEPIVLDSFLLRLLYRIPASLLLLFIIFLWSSSTTIISSSNIHVCVSSRKLSNLYCFSAGTQPANFSIPLPLVNNGSKLSVVGDSTKGLVNIPASQPATFINTKLILNVTHKDVVLSSNSPLDPPVKNYPAGSPTIPDTPASNVSNNGDIKLPGITDSSKDTSVSDGNTKEASKSSTKEASVSSSTMSSFSSKKAPDLWKGFDKAKVEKLMNDRKEVEGQMAVPQSHKAKSKPSDCEGRGIYVYDIPSKFNKDLLGDCSDMKSSLDLCKVLFNNGTGERIPELGKDWYNTHQFSLELIYHNRVLNHPCRVHNVEEAKLFYVPFYGGVDILRWHFKSGSTKQKDSLSKELVEWLKQQKPWNRNFGLDHVFVLGKISWDFKRVENGTWGTRLLDFDELQNPMKLLIERHPWHINDVGVPHPTYFHPSSDEDIIAWQSKIREVHRKNLVSFTGAAHMASVSISSILIEQCTSAPDNTCKFLDCRDGKCIDPAPVVNLFMESEFCLQPIGDSPTRKSLFDSLVAGCILVVFDPSIAYYQYPWHMPEDHRKYSVYIDQQAVRRSQVNVVERLVNVPLKERQEMRRYIIDELMPRLVYSHPNGELEKFEDAFYIAMNNLLERAVSKLP